MKKKFRHELKFYINKAQYELLRGRISIVLKPDENMTDPKGYHIRSLYFDDMYNMALREKGSGVYKRKKYRIRIYNLQSNIIKLECKEKIGDYISKTAVSLDKEKYNKIMNNDFTFDDNIMPIEFYYDFKSRLMRPVVIVDYVREAYVHKEGNVRVTFDKQLETNLDDLDIFETKSFNTKTLDNNLIVLEVKYDEYIPNFIKDLLNMKGLSKAAISKYVLCRYKRLELGSKV